MTKEEEAIKILSDSNILFNIQRDTALSIRVAIETVLNMLKEKDKEIEKKDKQIDLMAEEINITKPKHCTQTNVISLERVYMTKEEVKQYFERKATNNG